MSNKELWEGFVSAAQRKAVWASKADGGKGHPDNKKKKSKKEDVNEISKDMTGRYLKKVPASSADAGRKSAGTTGIGPEDQKKNMKKGINQFVNRQRGTSMAVDKMTGKARVPAKEDSDAVKAFLAKGGKIKKLPPAKAQGYHGKDDPGKDVAGVMNKPDTDKFKTRKKVKSMENKTFEDLRIQLSEALEEEVTHMTIPNGADGMSSSDKMSHKKEYKKKFNVTVKHSGNGVTYSGKKANVTKAARDHFPDHKEDGMPNDIHKWHDGRDIIVKKSKLSEALAEEITHMTIPDGADGMSSSEKMAHKNEYKKKFGVSVKHSGNGVTYSGKKANVTKAARDHFPDHKEDGMPNDIHKWHDGRDIIVKKSNK